MIDALCKEVMEGCMRPGERQKGGHDVSKNIMRPLQRLDCVPVEGFKCVDCKSYVCVWGGGGDFEQ